MKKCLFILMVVSVLVGRSQAADLEALKVDFGTSSSPVESGYQAYTASHEQPATFTTRSYSAFGTTVSITPSWASGAVAAAMQMFNRIGDGQYIPTTTMVALTADWIGTDTRSVGDPLTLTISGLPAGTYSWVSYHHDAGCAGGIGKFDVTVNDASGSVTTTNIQGTDNHTTAFADIAKFETTITSNGGNITLVFDNQPYTDQYNEAWFVMNGFKIEFISVPDPVLKTPLSGQGNVSVITAFQWTGPTAYTPSSYEVFLGTNPDVSANPSYSVGTEEFQPAEPLDNETTYYWAVIAYDGTTPYSSETWNFTTELTSISEFTGNSIINLSDFAEMAMEWLSCDHTMTDVTGDGCVNIQDLLVLVGDYWLHDFILKGPNSSPRERISINDNWRFMKYGSRSEADGLIYDNRSDIVNVAVVLKPWILPVGNDFVKNPGARHEYPQQDTVCNLPLLENTFDDSSWESVDLPHDWAIEGPFMEGWSTEVGAGMGRLPSPGVAWYRKTLDVPTEDAGKSIFLDVDGAMSYAMVWLNGHLVGGWPYGYASWRVDLTPRIVPGGQNQLAIRLDNPNDSSRWYPGGGIYRNVWLTKTQPIHIGQWGTCLTTPTVSESSATIDLEVTVDNNSGADAKVVVSTAIYALDAEGKKIGDPAAMIRPVNIAIGAGMSKKVNGGVILGNPLLWGPPPTQIPHLYVAVTTLWRQDTPVDQYETTFGIRDVQYNPNSGVYINGERIHLKGVNQHHDLGALGAAFNTRAAQRQLEILREMGCNAIRMAHNPPAPELLELTDRMGFLVFDEIFDTWQSGKSSLDFHLIFPEWHEQDLRSFIRRDRNHPSVIIWSFGNEVGEQYGGTAGAAIANELWSIVKDEDPTRPGTASMNYAKPDMPFPQKMDLISLNYQGEGIRYEPPYDQLGTSNRAAPQYAPFHAAFPTKVVLSSENAAAYSTRGTYLFPVTSYNSAPVSVSDGLAVENGYVSSYELYTDDFGHTADKVFAVQEQNPFVAGGFVWSGWDYLGEPPPDYLSRSSYYGIIDLAGFKKDRFYLYQSHWRQDLPMVHILPHWNWPGRVGQVTPVQVFTSGDQVELFLNNVSLGRKTKAQYEYRLRWNDVVYQTGELKAVAYKDGQPWAEETIETTGAAYGLEATVDRNVITADGDDLAFITVRITDANGRTVPTANNLVNFSVTGPGEIVATDNGSPKDMNEFPSHSRNAFSGLCLAIVRSQSDTPGTIQVTATSNSLQSVTLSVQTVLETQ